MRTSNNNGGKTYVVTITVNGYKRYFGKQFHTLAGATAFMTHLFAQMHACQNGQILDIEEV